MRMVANATDPSVSAHGRQRADKTRHLLSRKSKKLQVLEMQEDLRHELARAESPIHKAALVSAWDKLEDRLRILQGKPLPGSLVHDKVRVGKQRRALALSTYAPVAAVAAVADVAGQDASPADASQGDAGQDGQGQDATPAQGQG
jgi:hypothetical protein